MFYPADDPSFIREQLINIWLPCTVRPNYGEMNCVVAPKNVRVNTCSLFDQPSETAAAIEIQEFVVPGGDRTALADVLPTAADSIPRNVQNLLGLSAEHQFSGALTPKLAEIVDTRWNEKAS